jgi:hypothetical protein
MEERDRRNAETERMLREPGDHEVESLVVCVLTRFRLRNSRLMLLTYLDHRRVAREAAGVSGLLRSAFLVENSTTCYSLSLWASADSISHFGSDVPVHVTAARRMFSRVLGGGRSGPEIWSTKWRLSAVSNNLRWDTFDLRTLLVEDGG